MYDVVALGEYLIDFSPNGVGKMGNPCYEMNPGGAPANCLAACAGLGGSAALIASVGDDVFGRFLIDKAAGAGIDIRHVRLADTSTTLVFVSVGEGGERTFSFVRSPGADTLLTRDDVPRSLLSNTKYFHFGTLSMTSEPSRSATRFAAQLARSLGARVSFDPNYRLDVWDGEETAREHMLWGVENADMVKLSEEELFFLTGKDVVTGARSLLEMGPDEVYVTAGAKGAYYFTKSGSGFVPGFEVDAVDTTGCGDAFTGAMLYQHCRAAGSGIAAQVRFANAVGALCATKPGGICAMPGPDEVRRLMAEQTDNAL